MCKGKKMIILTQFKNLLFDYFQRLNMTCPAYIKGAQHNNGGLAVDLNWQTTVSGLYAAGEAAGTFGIARPGGRTC